MELVELPAHLQRPRCEVNTRTGNAFWLEPHKDVCPQAVVHVVPERQDTRNIARHCKVVWWGFVLVLRLQRLVLSAFSY